MNTAKRVVVTGGSGFVGQLLRRGLSERGYAVECFDVRRGFLVDVLRRRQLSGTPAALPLQQTKKRLERRLSRSGRWRTSGDDILDLRSRLSARFAGAHAIVHLAGIPHPYLPGAIDADFHRINQLGSINVFEAGRDAGVGSFVFASSGQVYAINAPRPTQFPLRESDPVPESGLGVNLYGLLKHDIEKHLASAARDRPTPTVATALRLEFPGMRSRDPANLFVSTSIENLVAGFVGAIEAPGAADGETFNLCDAWVDLDVVDVQRFITERFPGVPNETIGNESLVSVEKIRHMLGYSPSRGGTYLDPRLM